MYFINYLIFFSTLLMIICEQNICEKVATVRSKRHSEIQLTSRVWFSPLIQPITTNFVNAP
jgi:hypothetical protein